MNIHQLWRDATTPGKLNLLNQLTQCDQSVCCKLLGCSMEELDTFTVHGYSKVWVTVVDAAGMREYDPGLVRLGRRVNDFGLKARK
jgi:tRNA U34 5-carboxymethylaminomethyl modifying GTPase MnmE/TrmE